MRIRVPATTANMGPGFDSIGMALQLYNYCTIEERPTGLSIEMLTDPEGRVPRDESNLIYQSFVRFYEELSLGTPPGISIVQEDYIPMTRGLGSSAACIVAGLLAANQISNAGLGKDALAYMAAKIEGHPDNTSPALLGGLVVGVLTDKNLKYIKIDDTHWKTLQFYVLIPNFLMSTAKARKVLPKTYTTAEVVFNAGRTALLTAAFLTGDFSLLHVAMDDCVHQPYRMKLVPDMEGIFRRARTLGAQGVFLSGAGPCIVAVTEQGHFDDAMREYLRGLQASWDVKRIMPDMDGAKIEL